VSVPHNLPLVVVGIGASAGGLQAYTELLESLPPNTGMAIAASIRSVHPSRSVFGAFTGGPWHRLSLVRTLVELHGGSIVAHSEGPGSGSEFTVRFPLMKHAEAPSDQPTNAVAPEAQVQARSRSQRVLVVDDNPDIRESTSMMLSLIDHETRVAGSGEEALQLAIKFQPTVILLDIGLPDLSGYEVARRLRETGEFAATRIIAISGYDTPEARDRAAEAGFDHHLSKPVPLQELENLLSE
jgi:CheY-like chemotaxis protein